MAKREVLEVTCDRCKRTETQRKEEANGSDQPEFRASQWFNAENREHEVVFQDLCRNCRRAVTNYFQRIFNVGGDEKTSSTDGPLAPGLR